MSDEELVGPREAAPPVARRFGRYTLIKKLATGGMAEIWLATHQGVADFVRFVVVKKILPHLSEQKSFVGMFLDEARMSAQLNHPNVVQIYDLGKEGGSYYIAMEYIPGENLSALAWRGLKVERPLPPLFAAKIMADAAKGLHYAHELRGTDGQPLGIVHRDISPQNILVTYEGEVKVVDFGIAKAASKSEATKTGMLKGKFSYMSPEQARGLELDRRSDVFALGIVLWELVTGMRLFKHESELMILEMVTQRAIPPPVQFAPNVPPELDRVIMRALERDPAARWPSAQALQIALEEVLRTSPRPVTSADLATYVRALFEDSMREKRSLCEAAARGEIPFADEPSGPRAPSSLDRPSSSMARAPSAVSRAPSAVSRAPSAVARAPSSIASGPSPGATPSGAYDSLGGSGSGAVPLARIHTRPNMAAHVGAPHPGQPSTQPQLFAEALSYSGYQAPPMPPPTRPWLAWAGVAALFLAIGGALAFLIPMALRPPTQVVLKRGAVAISSRPEGARVSIEGKPFLDASGKALVTPLELSQLDYGATYHLKLEKDGHRPLEHAITMGDDTNGKTVVLALEASPATLLVKMSAVGPDQEGVELLVDGQRVGMSPVVRVEHAPGKATVTARAAGRTCTVVPESQELAPGASAEAIVTCRRGRAPGNVAQPVSGQTASVPPEGGQTATAQTDSGQAASGQAGKGAAVAVNAATEAGCAPTPGMAPGWVTLNSHPYADVYVGTKLVGQTPLPKLPLPAGCAMIRLVNPDTKQERTVKVDVKPNLVSLYELEL